MSRRPDVQAEPVPRLGLRPDEAAVSIGMSRDTFDKYVLPELRIVRVGDRKVIPVAELGRWLERSAGIPLRDELRGAGP